MITNNIILFHLNIYIFGIYSFICAQKQHNLYRELRNIFKNKENSISLLKHSIYILFIEETCFGIYLPELLSYIFNNIFYINLIASLCFSIGHIVNYLQLKTLNLQNIRISIAQIIFTFILRYCFLIDQTPLIALLLHQYNNLCCILFNVYLYN